MKSLERRFNNIQKENPYWGDIIVFSHAVKEKDFSPRTIRRWFSRLVPADKYNKKDKKKIITHILDLSRSKSAEDGTKSTNN